MYVRKTSSKHDDITVATQLCYPRIVIDMLKRESDPDKRQKNLNRCSSWRIR